MKKHCPDKVDHLPTISEILPENEFLARVSPLRLRTRSITNIKKHLGISPIHSASDICSPPPTGNFVRQRAYHTRMRLSREQTAELEQVFEINQNPDARVKKLLCLRFNAPYKTILYWFQNRRAEYRKIMREGNKLEHDGEKNFNSE